MKASSTLALALLFGSLSACRSAPPPPRLSSFLPADYRVVRSEKVDLDGSGVPQVAVSAIGTTANGPAPSTILLLAWDRSAKRWTAVFDASKREDFMVHPQTSAPGPGLTLSAPRFAVVRNHPGRMADLIFWIDAAGGNGTELNVGIIHFAGLLAEEVWSFGGQSVIKTDPGDVIVVGTSPTQRVRITAPLFTADDAHCCPVRNYAFEVAPRSDGNGYQVVTDDRPLVGVKLISSSSNTPPENHQAIVVNVIAGSPASGVLQTGDRIDGVDGEQLPANVGGLLGLDVLDEVALHRPGDTIAIDVERGGQRKVLRLTLGTWNESSTETQYFVPGYLGIAVQQASSGSGLIVTPESGGPADLAGIPSGATLRFINDVPTPTLDDLMVALFGLQAGDDARVRYIDPSGTTGQATVTVGQWPESATPPQPFAM